MIKKLEESAGAVLGFEISGKITLEQEQETVATVENVLKDHDKVSLLVVLGEHADWGVKAGMEDLKWTLKHLKQINKVAIVSSSTVLKWLTTLDSPFAKMIGMEEKHFEDLDQAWAWIKS